MEGRQVTVYKLPDGKCQKLTSEQWEGGEHIELRTNERGFLGPNSSYSPANALQETRGSETH